MTRIKYKRNYDDNTFVSNKDFLTNTQELVKVYLYLDVLKGYIIYYDDNSMSHKPFIAKTLPALKKQAKRELEALGVVFKSEVRPRIKAGK